MSVSQLRKPDRYSASSAARARRHAERMRDEKIKRLPAERQAELDEIIETMLDEEEDRRDMMARRKLVQRVDAQQDADL